MSADPLPQLDGVAHRWVDAGGVRIHAAQAGAGPDVVLLHGWPQDWWLWREVIGVLAPRARVTCLDLRGHGWSQAPAGGYEKEELADDVLLALDALEIERFALAGHDWGGWIGFLLCLRVPERVQRFLACNIAHPFPSPGLGLLRTLPRFWYQAAMALPGLAPLLLRHAPRTIAPLLTGVAPAERARLAARLAQPEHAAATMAIYRAFLTRELGPLVAGRYADRRLTVPTHALFGTRDFAIDRRLIEDLPEHADDAVVELVEGVGHFIVDERPDLVAARAQGWLLDGERP